MRRRPPKSTLFPYPALFRSGEPCPPCERQGCVDHRDVSAARDEMAAASGHPNGWADRAARRNRHGTLRRGRSEEHTSELQSRQYLVCRLLLEKKHTRRVVLH